MSNHSLLTNLLTTRPHMLMMINPVMYTNMRHFAVKQGPKGVDIYTTR